MRVRFSNEVNFAVEFTAITKTEFEKKSRRARLEFFGAQGASAQLFVHVQSDSGVWLPANYPALNKPWRFLFHQQFPSDLYHTCRESNAGSTWAEFEVQSLAKLVVEGSSE